MGAELIGILSVGAALAALILGVSHRHRDDMKGMRGEIHGLRDEVRGEIHGLRGEMQGMRAELREEIQGVRSEVNDLRGEVHEFRVEITDRVARIEAKVFNGAAAEPGNAA